MVGLKTSTREISRSHVQLRRFRIRVVEGPDAGLAVGSIGDELTIGAAAGNDIKLHDPTVSRHHCTLAITPDGIRLRDLESTNGTCIGGQRIAEALLTDRATFAVGGSVLVFEPLDDSISEPLSDRRGFGSVIGASVAMRRVFSVLERVAPSDATVLIEGETGTGKGLLAEAIHQESPRRDGPFVVVDCTTLPDGLCESELFGHVAAAFTGASTPRDGLLARADGGTIFFDEIGELPLSLQPKLLRALEEGCVRPVGSSEMVRFDARAIAATNVDLRRAVNRREFRADLFYRLNTVRVVLPPLRERPEDIIPIIAAIYREVTGDPQALPPAGLARAFKAREWPGNVRELRNAVERALLVPSLRPATETAEVHVPDSFRDAKSIAMSAWEREFLRKLVIEHDGNLSRASRAVSMDRSHLRNLLRQHGIDVEREILRATR